MLGQASQHVGPVFFDRQDKDSTQPRPYGTPKYINYQVKGPFITCTIGFKLGRPF